MTKPRLTGTVEPVRTLSQQTVTAAHQPTYSSLSQHPNLSELLSTSLFRYSKASLVYFLLDGGFGCYQVVAGYYQTHVWLVNRRLAALQAPHSVQQGRAEPRGAVTLIPPLSLPNSLH